MNNKITLLGKFRKFWLNWNSRSRRTKGVFVLLYIYYHICMYVCVCMYVCMYVCMCNVYVYVYMYMYVSHNCAIY